MPRQTRQERLDALVAAFTELGPAWGRWLNATMPGPGVSYPRLREDQLRRIRGAATARRAR